MKLPILPSRCVHFVAVVSSFLLGASSQAAPQRIVPCDKPVQSVKRGVCLNEVSREDFLALGPGVSWYYNWHFADTQHAPAEANITFIPMAWGDREADVKGLAEYLSKNKPPIVLAINEPNLKGQAFINPEKTATLYRKIKAVADKHNIPVIGPNMALGSGDDSSIKAFDPIEKKEVTYTYQTPFLKAFFHFMGNTEIPAVASHTYGNASELEWMIGQMHKDFQRPVWVTEFADWHAKNEEAEIDYMIKCVEAMERAPHVHGYAWFKERVKDNSKLSLLGEKPGTLTPLGEAYVNMPVHDPAVFYRLPGRLQLESYTTMASAELARTKDADGFLEMKLGGADGWLEYQVFSEKERAFTAKLRVATTEGGAIEITANDKPLGTFTAAGKGWQTLSVPVTLPAGTSKFRIQTKQASRLNWLEFADK